MNITVVQSNSGPDRETNLDRCETYINEAAARGAELVVFPENILFRGKDSGYRDSATSVPGHVSDRLCALSRTHGIAVVWGAVVEQSDIGLHNSCIVISAEGDILSLYRKIHLFELYNGATALFREADLFTPGKDIITVSLGSFSLGLSICYDLRFPELYRSLSARGADVLLVPSDFTRPTGQAHWLPLLQARAIENLAYVIAPNQCGANFETGALSHGHSCIISPWGDVLAACDGERESMCSADITSAAIADARARIRSLQHRV